MMKRLEIKLKEKINKDIKLINHNDFIEINNDLKEELNVNDAKEAILFSLLAYLYQNKVPSNILSVTGANKNVVLGKQTY
jgi:hypothetical protein